MSDPVTKQGFLKDHAGDYIAPNTCAAQVLDEARNRGLSASLLALVERNALGYPAFVTTEAHAVGDVCFRDRRLWKFIAPLASGAAWDSTKVREFSIKELVEGIVSALLSGEIAPALAVNISSWEAREDLSTDDVWQAIVRTTAGDVSIDSSKGARILSIIARTDFKASTFETSGFNLLRKAVAVGTGYYFLVPAMSFGTYGTATKPNGILFTDSEGNNLTPTVYFKPLSSGVPESVDDGSACAYTDSNGHRFYTTPQAGYIIVSGITLVSTCAHVAWSGRYDEYVSVGAEGDGGSSISLTTILNAVHSDVKKLLVVGSVADSVDFGASAATWHRRVGRTAPVWTTIADEVGEGQTQTYTHSAIIAAMLPGGEAAFENDNVVLKVDGNVVSYQDSSDSATADYVKYQLLSETTGTVSMGNALSVEDWGLEFFTGAEGSAIVTTQYAQSYPDNLAALVSGKLAETYKVISEAIAQINERLSALEVSRERFGNVVAQSLETKELTRDLYPTVLLAHGVPAAATVPTNLPEGLPWDGVPVFVGQLYINLDAESGGLYYAIGVSSIENWKTA